MAIGPIESRVGFQAVKIMERRDKTPLEEVRDERRNVAEAKSFQTSAKMARILFSKCSITDESKVRCNGNPIRCTGCPVTKVMGTKMATRWAVILGSSSGFEPPPFARTRRGTDLWRTHGSPWHNATGGALIDELKQYGVPVHFHNDAASDDERTTALDALGQHLEASNGTVQVLLHSLAFGTLRPYVSDDSATIGRKHMDMTLDVMAHSLVYWTQDLIKRGQMVSGSRISP